MYACIVHFSIEKKSELLKLLNSNIIRSKKLRSDRVFLKTRKFWKLFWFNQRFKKFPREFSYYEFSDPYRNIKVPLKIQHHFVYTIEQVDSYTKKLSIYFSNINDIWKIKLLLFLKK